MDKRKKRIAIGGAAALAVAAAVAVAAYFAAKDEKPNMVAVGEDTVSIAETFTPPDQTKPYQKLVKISNTGTIPCYVRARIEFSDSDSQSHASFSGETADPEASAPADNTFFPADPTDSDSYTKHLPADWVYNETDGYYYYKNAVKPGEETNALLAWVKMNYGNNEQAAAHDIYVYSESVQTVDPKTGSAYTDYSDAWTKFTAAAEP